MSAFDLIVRNGNVVEAEGVSQLDLGITDGHIVALEPDLSGTATEIIDARGLHVFSGVIDAHVHFNEPGRTHWEGFATGSRAFAAGGGTTFFDMPLNASPPTLDGQSFDLKLAAARAASLTDFALWGGLVPGNLDKLSELHERGVIGFKAFMSNSGIEDFQSVDDHSLREGMKRVARLGSIVAVHAESEAMTRELSQQAIDQNRTGIRDYLDSRPIAAELDAIRCALDMAGETGCALHVVHVSSGEGVALIREAQTRGANVTCETCPHYLVLTEDDAVKLGAAAKCAPPLRSTAVQENLWRREQFNALTTIGSDHSPAPADMKTDANFFKVWGGIAGVQHTLPLLLTEGHWQRGYDLPHLSRLLSANVATRFRLPPQKGRIAIGHEADLALVRLEESFVVRREELLDRHRLSPYVGRSLRGQVVRTLLRGTTIFKDGEIVSKPLGRLLKPVRT